MSRLLTCGFEMGYVPPQAGSGSQIEDPLLATGGNNSGATCAVATDQARSGLSSLKVGQTGTSGTYALQGAVITGVLSRTYWSRVAVRYGAMGTTNLSDLVATYSTGLAGGMRVKINKSGVLTVTNYASTTLLTGPTLALNTWYVLEWQHNLSTGAGQFWVDGVSYGTYTADVATTGTPLIVLYCPSGASGGHLMWFDDWAINDDQGASQNGRIGNQGKIVLLKPISDNARVGFTGGAGGTTNLFQAVDNTPPVGVVLASATATSQIKDATSNTTDSYTANLGAYSTAVASGGGGIGASDVITLVQGVASHGNSSTTARTNGLTVASNPTVAEATAATGTTAAGTFPTGWTTFKSIVTIAPSVTKGASPTVKFRKGSASTDSSMAALLGLYVEYIPVLPQPLITTAQAVASASNKVTAAQKLTPVAQATAAALATVTRPVPLTITAQALGWSASMGLTAPLQISPVAQAQAQAATKVTTPSLLTPIAQAQTQALMSVTAASKLSTGAQSVAQATAQVTAKVPLAPSAVALTQATSLVSSGAPPLIPVSAGAQAQATAKVITPVFLAPVSASTSSGQALVTVATQISILPVQATSGAGALVTVTTQISILPVQASAGAGALVTVATQISILPVQATSGAGALVTVTTQISLDPIVAVARAGEVLNNVTAPVLLSSI